MFQRKRAVGTAAIAVLQSFLLALGCGQGPGGLGSEGQMHPPGQGRGSSANAGLAGHAPSSATVTDVDEGHADFESPVNHSGSFVHRLPIELPEALEGMKPSLDLSYSSQAGDGLAGFGWDISIPRITLNPAEGTRPLGIGADLDRFADGTAVRRYASPFGDVVAVRTGAETAFGFDPNNDMRVKPIAGAGSGGTVQINGEIAAWEVTGKDGSRLRFGTGSHSSVWRDEGVGGREQKVGWLLEQTEDRLGNLVRYYHEEYPGNQDELRQPLIRAIEYGIPASNTTTPWRYVVLFNYIPVPTPRTSHVFGTPLDQAFVVDEVCLYARTSVAPASTPGGHRRWVIGGAQSDPIPQYCYELDYQFEDSGLPQGYSGRALLTSVRKVGADGTATTPWRFDYTAQQVAWEDVYRDAVDSPVEGTNYWEHAVADASMLLGTTRASQVQKLADLNGDGLLDNVQGAPDGTVSVQLATGTGYATDSWPHPLASLDAVRLHGLRLSTKDSSRSNTWYDFEYETWWTGGGGGLGFARALTAATPNYWDIYDTASTWDEAEGSYVDLGMFQFLSNAYYGPYPAIGKRNAVSPARTIDELETFGAYKDTKAKERAFDFRSSDGQDAYDKSNIDYCWNAGKGRTGMMGADLSCLDAAGQRWSTRNRQEESYASGLWELRDMNGDGRDDWVFASNIMQRNEDGDLRDLRFGNDWWVAFAGDGEWEEPVRWAMPAKTGSALGIADVEFVHSTGLLSTSVSASSEALRASGLGVSVCMGVGGISTTPTLGGVSVPTRTPKAAGVAALGYGLGQSDSVAAPGLVLSMASTIRSVATGGSLAPSACLDISKAGVVPSVQVPIIGDLVDGLQGDMSGERTQLFQGMVDLTGDGLPDYVVSRFDAGDALNSTRDWLVYRNSGTGFEDPTVFSFEGTPIEPSGAKTLAIQTDFNWSYTKARWFSSSTGLKETAQFGTSHNTSGLADLDGDGLLDFVTTQYNGSATFPISPGDPVDWLVYFNQGDGFGRAVSWEFDGGFTSPGCAAVNSAPVLSRSVFYTDPFEGVGDGYTRQVMGLVDANLDGLLDFAFVEPFDKEDNILTDGFCDYLPGHQVTANSRDRWISFTDPQSLNKPLRVALNTGHGFAPAQEWVDSDGLPLSGGRTWRDASAGWFDGQRVDHSASRGITGTGDLNHDGVPDLAVLKGGVGGSNFSLYKIGEGNPDRIAVLEEPYGGRLEIDYAFHTEPGGKMGRGQWVVSEIIRHDISGEQTDDGSDILDHRQYWYEHGLFDAKRHRFVGFERVYERAVGGAGFTMTRFHQSRELEGLKYCREVRRLDTSEGGVGDLVDARISAWASGGPTDYQPAVAAVDPNKAATSVSALHDVDDPSPDPAEDEASNGGSEDLCHGSYAPDEEELEGEEAENEEIATVEAEAEEVYLGVIPDDPSEDTTKYEVDEDDCYADPIDSDPWWPDLGPIAALDDRLDEAYGGCGHSTSTVYDGVQYDCSDPRDALDDESCGDPSDLGTVVKEELFLWTDLSTIPDTSTPRLMHTQTRVYEDDGLNPFVSDTHYEYDGFGNIVREEVLGDDTTTEDDLVTVTTYAAPNLLDFVVAMPCHVVSTADDGTILRERWIGYDGGLAGSCTMTVNALPTHERHGVDGSSSVDIYRTFSVDGLARSETDPRGNTVHLEYDPDFPWLPVKTETDVSMIVGVAGTSKTTVARTRTTEKLYHGVHNTQFDRFGLLAQELDDNGRGTDYGYDSLRRLTFVWKPGDTYVLPSQRFSYDMISRPARVERADRVTPSGIGTPQWRTTATLLDGFGREFATRGIAPPNAAGASHVMTDRRRYDAEGRVVATYPIHFDGTLTDDESTRSTYDLIGRLTSTTAPNGGETRRDWEANVYTEEDADGNVSYHELDARDQEVLVAEYTGAGATLYRTTTTEYLPTGEIERVIDNAGNTWTQSHDRMGRVVEAFSPDTGRREFRYDSNGNPVAVIDDRTIAGASATSLVARTDYDELNRPIWREELSYASVTPTSVTGTIAAVDAWYYDSDPGSLPGAMASCAGTTPEGRLARADRYVDDGGGLALVSQKEFCYDDRGRLTEFDHTIDGATYHFRYSYDNVDQVTRTETPDGDTVTTTYDVSGSIQSEVSAAVGDLVTVAQYEADGQPTSETLGGTALAAHRCYEFGATNDRVLRRLVATESSGSVSCGADASSDVITGTTKLDLVLSLGNRGEITARDEQVLNTITGSTESHAASYAYDELRRLQDETYDGVTVSFGYDELDNFTAHEGIVQSYGDAARATRNAGPHALLTTDDGIVLGYDEIGNAVSLQTASTTYDLRFNSHQRVVEVQDAGAVVQINRYDEAGHRVSSLDASGTVVFPGGDYRRDADGSDVRLLPGIGFIHTPPSGSAELYLSLSDSVGSTSVVYDHGGDLVQYVRYRAFGAIRNEDVFDPDPSDGLTPYQTPDLFDGERRQSVFSDADVFDFGARLYLAPTGRWLSADPVFLDGLNQYAFVQNDPINKRDIAGYVSDAVMEEFLHEVSNFTGQPGVYFIRGQNETSGNPMGYVGMSSDLAGRVGSESHKKVLKVLSHAEDTSFGAEFWVIEARHVVRAANAGVSQRDLRRWVEQSVLDETEACLGSIGETGRLNERQEMNRKDFDALSDKLLTPGETWRSYGTKKTVYRDPDTENCTAADTASDPTPAQEGEAAEESTGLQWVLEKGVEKAGEWIDWAISPAD